MILGLTHVAVRVSSLKRSLDFYTRVLGLEEQFRLSDEAGEPWLVYLKVADNQFIELFPEAQGPHQPAKCAGLVHICLRVDDINEAYGELKKRGAVIRGEPMLGDDGSWQFWTEDPDGNPIEFHQFTAESRQHIG